jgi:hypothetical protein
VRFVIVAITVGSLAAGCAGSLRLGAAPTVDSDGRWGAMVTVGIALGDTYRQGEAAVLVSADLSTAADARAATRGNAGHLALGLGLDALGESPHFGFRLGATLTGRVLLPTGVPGGAGGARLALLPVIHTVHAGHKPTHCGESESWTYWHLGLELTGQYLWGPDARGLFSFGPIFELDTLSPRVCD